MSFLNSRSLNSNFPQHNLKVARVGLTIRRRSPDRPEQPGNRLFRINLDNVENVIKNHVFIGDLKFFRDELKPCPYRNDKLHSSQRKSLKDLRVDLSAVLCEFSFSADSTTAANYILCSCRQDQPLCKMTEHGQLPMQLVCPITNKTHQHTTCIVSPRLANFTRKIGYFSPLKNLFRPSLITPSSLSPTLSLRTPSMAEPPICWVSFEMTLGSSCGFVRVPLIGI